MGMNVKSGDSAEDAPVAEINVTPLVDVMLVLLIIFMVSMPAMMNQLSIEIPKKSLAPPPPNVKPKPTMYVVVDDFGAYSIQFGDEPATPVAFEALPQELLKSAEDYAKELVYVKAAPRLDYGRVVTLIEILGKSGYNKVALDQNKDAAPLDGPAGAAPAEAVAPPA